LAIGFEKKFIEFKTKKFKFLATNEILHPKNGWFGTLSSLLLSGNQPFLCCEISHLG
jgi:hypothetical protein